MLQIFKIKNKLIDVGVLNEYYNMLDRSINRETRISLPACLATVSPGVLRLGGQEHRVIEDAVAWQGYIESAYWVSTPVLGVKEVRFLLTKR